jgi:hypothetical protein
MDGSFLEATERLRKVKSGRIDDPCETGLARCGRRKTKLHLPECGSCPTGSTPWRHVRNPLWRHALGSAHARKWMMGTNREVQQVPAKPTLGRATALSCAQQPAPLSGLSDHADCGHTRADDARPTDGWPHARRGRSDTRSYRAILRRAISAEAVRASGLSGFIRKMSARSNRSSSLSAMIDAYISARLLMAREPWSARRLRRVFSISDT